MHKVHTRLVGDGSLKNPWRAPFPTYSELVCNYSTKEAIVEVPDEDLPECEDRFIFFEVGPFYDIQGDESSIRFDQQEHSVVDYDPSRADEFGDKIVERYGLEGKGGMVRNSMLRYTTVPIVV
tara:strand:- start:6520 stop:6888 length:369 start_codon:yes stop_codon:yes gene_type:complete